MTCSAAAVQMELFPRPKRQRPTIQVEPISVASAEVEARCEACGHTWKQARGDAFRCPYCANAPTAIRYESDDHRAVLADEVSEGW